LTETVKNKSIAVVVLTMHRFKKLKHTIQCLREQTRKLDEIIVVYQGAGEEIKSWLEQQADITLHVQENLGSAGGFSTGMQLAVDKGHDWVWITDDDAFPEVKTLEHLVSCKHFDDEATGFLTCVVVDAEGQTYMSPVPDDANRWYGDVLEEKCLPVISSAWPGCLVSVNAIKQCGLPIAEYFFYDEDVEFTSRVARSKPSFCVIEAVMHHHQEPASDLWQSPVRYKHFVRNKFSTIRLSDDSAVKKLAKQLLWAIKVIAGVFVGKRPVGALQPLVSGLFFFRPKIKYPNERLKKQ
jgi:rhamnopyranosyl-N-acetylglucosaminyl-diphospho-decaprenol beta-1,3/1,4-galactofuranosyltransferase